MRFIYSCSWLTVLALGARLLVSTGLLLASALAPQLVVLALPAQQLLLLAFAFEAQQAGLVSEVAAFTALAELSELVAVFADFAQQASCSEGETLVNFLDLLQNSTFAKLTLPELAHTSLRT